MPYEEWIALGKSLGIPARPWWLGLIYGAVAIAVLLGIVSPKSKATGVSRFIQLQSGAGAGEACRGADKP